MLNETLSAEDRSKLTVWFFFIKLLMTALAAEPRYIGTVWRGVKADIGGEYKKGKKVRWWRFSSCTEDGDVLSTPMFLGDSGKRTLFSIDCTTGIKIQHLSAYSNEAEVRPCGNLTISLPWHCLCHSVSNPAPPPSSFSLSLSLSLSLFLCLSVWLSLSLSLSLWLSFTGSCSSAFSICRCLPAPHNILPCTPLAGRVIPLWNAPPRNSLSLRRRGCGSADCLLSAECLHATALWPAITSSSALGRRCCWQRGRGFWWQTPSRRAI
eukprot:COSAG01_NODE_9084_length_2561_cov_40.592201_2_plen_266_part_00